MSRSNNTELVSPSTKWISWSGSEGKLEVYNKELKIKEEVPMPFTFILLDELQTIKGFSESDNDGIYANEVKDLHKEPLNVRVGKNSIEIGLYKDIKDRVKVRGGKYAKSCYIAYFDENKKLCIGNIMMVGSSLAGGKYKDENKKEIELGGWMAFATKNRGEIYKQAITITLEEIVCVKGANGYRIPKFTLKPVSEETNKQAELLDVELQKYLKAYLNKNTEEQVADLIPNDIADQINGAAYDAQQQAMEQSELDSHKARIEANNAPAHIGTDDMPFIVTALIGLSFLTNFI